jgi:hypothetical protein
MVPIPNCLNRGVHPTTMCQICDDDLPCLGGDFRAENSDFLYEFRNSCSTIQISIHHTHQGIVVEPL